MNIEYYDGKSISTHEIVESKILLDGKIMILEVKLTNDKFDECIECETDYWNSLTLKQKNEVHSVLRDEFN